VTVGVSVGSPPGLPARYRMARGTMATVLTCTPRAAFDVRT
jgi:hypothetical protein